MRMRAYKQWKLIGPLGLSVQVVWFSEEISLDGPVMFRTELEAWLYIQFTIELHNWMVEQVWEYRDKSL